MVRRWILGFRSHSIILSLSTLLFLSGCGGKKLGASLTNEVSPQDESRTTAPAQQPEVAVTTCLSGSSELCKRGMHSTTLISTPSGFRKISALKAGDKVNSGAPEAKVVAHVQAVRKLFVGADYKLVQVKFHTGLVMKVSKLHPLPNKQEWGDLQVGTMIGGMQVMEMTEIEDNENYTYDILTDTDGGAYHAGNAKGVLKMESTLSDNY